MNHFELVLTEEHPSAQVYIHYFRSCYCLYDHFEGTKGLYVQVFYGRNQSETRRDELILKLIVGGSELMACDDDPRQLMDAAMARALAIHHRLPSELASNRADFCVDFSWAVYTDLS